MDKADFAIAYNEELMKGVTPEQTAVAPATVAAPQPAERTWGEAAEDVFGNVIDAMANGKRGLAILGSGIAAAANTDGFQQQKNRLAYEYAQNQRAQERHDRAMRAEDFRFAEAQKDVPVNDARRKIALINAKTSQLAAEQRFRDVERGQIDKNMRDRIAADPELGQYWNALNEKERDDVMGSSGTILRNKDFEGVVRDLLRSRDGDSESWSRFNALVGQARGRVVDDGKGNYTVEIAGKTIPLNEQSAAELQKTLWGAVGEEIKARYAISLNATNGNAMTSLQADWVKRMIPYYANNAAQATQVFRNTVGTFDNTTKYTMVTRHTLENLLKNPDDPGALQAVQQLIAPDANGMSILKRLGYDVRINEENPLASQITRKNTDGSISSMSLPTFLDELKARDKGSQILETQVEGMKQQAARKIMMDDAKYKAEVAKALRKGGKGSGISGWAEDMGDGQGQEQKKLDDQSLSVRVRQFGGGFDALDHEMQIKVDDGLRKIDKYIVGSGYGRGGANGTAQIDVNNIPKEELTTAVQMEENALKGTKLDKNSGFYHMVRDYRQAVADEERLMAESKEVQRKLREGYASGQKPGVRTEASPKSPVDYMRKWQKQSASINNDLAEAREKKARLGKKLGIKEKNPSTNGK